MIHRVLAFRVAGDLLVEDLVFLGCGGSRRGVAAQADEGWVEPGHITGEELCRIALRIDRDEQDLHPGGVRSEQIERLLHRRQAGRADIRAMRETEEQRDQLALVIGQGTRLTGVVGQREAPAVFGAGHVDAAITRAGRSAASKRDGKQRGREEAAIHSGM